MRTVEESVDVAAPLRVTYDQWTRFESFPWFMPWVHQVTWISPTRLRWQARIGDTDREFEAEITAREPEVRLAWRSVEEPAHRSEVTFRQVDRMLTRVTMRLDYQPGSLPEQGGTALGAVGHRLSGDLAGFKDFIERGGSARWAGAG